jgi:hypothetical protein
MLTIRSKQLRAFQPAAEAAFIDRVAKHIRDNHSDAEVGLPSGKTVVERLPDRVLRKMVESGVASARRYGISWESTLTAFVVLMFVVAPNFDKHPILQRVLSDREIPPDSRLDGLWERTSEQNWEAARGSYDAAAWGIDAGSLEEE